MSNSMVVDVRCLICGKELECTLVVEGDVMSIDVLPCAGCVTATKCFTVTPPSGIGVIEVEP